MQDNSVRKVGGWRKYHYHDGYKVLNRALKCSKHGTNGTHYETVGHLCPVCGVKLNAVGKAMQLAALQKLMG